LALPRNALPGDHAFVGVPHAANFRTCIPAPRGCAEIWGRVRAARYCRVKRGGRVQLAGNLKIGILVIHPLAVVHAAPADV
jgi:hypothetical protein